MRLEANTMFTADAERLTALEAAWTRATADALRAQKEYCQLLESSGHKPDDEQSALFRLWHAQQARTPDQD
jgi:DNA-binding PucR family transcriptional regulator